ncbi:monofunctional biosynthetic peptidoglycan transglycosylase [Sphingomonas sinipercae]|uniref:Biosynthetic peptidoglycan transglycosylase n=1 Tax=Sphingomonas sinipercae TaxID=2714944 RepID=A0A6G7ZR08_9SPHN|nr:monofunctional biosynthetic peptidoglycan transglycosylase [Sphingomonas sinipercae]
MVRPFIWLFKLILILAIISVLWVFEYKFFNPPTTATMISDKWAGRGATRKWMPIEQIDRDMVRAAIAAEDGKFCQHNGFDIEAIEDAMKRNASGGRIRGGSTISQQTAKNAFLWQGGGYPRKAAEAWFTFLIENLWGKRRIMEVYLNIAETGIGTYGVNAGSMRYFGHDAKAMSRTEAARIAAILPLPKARGATSPKGFTKRYGNTIATRIGTVARDGLDACVYKGIQAPPERTPEKTKSGPLPGSEYESAKPLPPVEKPVSVPAEEAPVEADPATTPDPVSASPVEPTATVDGKPAPQEPTPDAS